MVERPASKRTLAELTAELEVSGQATEERITAADGPENERVLCHIVGIERWDQQRLRVALGEPFMMDESDSFQSISFRRKETCTAQLHV